MHPIIIRLPFLPEAFQQIYSYGLMMVLGFFAAYILSYRMFKRCGQNPDDLTNIAVLALIGGIIGARGLYVIHFWSDYAEEPLWKMINVRDGGLEFYGGVIVAMVAALAYMNAKKLPVRFYLDILAPALMLGLAFGRMGCFLNGCCYGKMCELPWAISFPYGSYAYYDQLAQGQLSVPEELTDGHNGIIPRENLTPDQRIIADQHRSRHVHPSQLYSIAVALGLSAVLYRFFWKRKYHGQVFLLMLILYGIARFALEMVRTEPKVLAGLSISQTISVPAVVAGGIWWIAMTRQAPGQVDAQTGKLTFKNTK